MREVRAVPTLPTKKEKEAPLEGVRRFFRNVSAELKKVNWPNRKELITYTIVVFAVIFVVAAIISTWDLILTGVFKLLRFYR